jgi:hypothetical protein
MPRNPDVQAIRQTEPKLTDACCLHRHWPEYLMEGGETAIYLFSACTAATWLCQLRVQILYKRPEIPANRVVPAIAISVT